MSFTSPIFFAFLLLLLLVLRLAPFAQRKFILLGASILFVLSWSILTLFIALILSVFNWYFGNKLHKKESPSFFYFGLAINLLAILSANYLIFSAAEIDIMLKEVSFQINEIILSIGISFYSLQHISYLIDVKKMKVNPEKDLSTFLLYTLYFPKFISGPIIKFRELNFTINNPSPELQLKGLNRFMLGLFKKVILADRLSETVSSIYDHNDQLPGLTLFTGALLFTIQLYFDFSGYCDMAIGISNLLGITLMENFDFPLRSGSITQFWRKWHKSLISFFTEYIFYPINFRLRKNTHLAIVVSICIVFIASGLWHGLGLTFFCWALCHMIYLWIEYFLKLKRIPSSSTKFINKLLGGFYVILLVSLSNVFFRATSFAVSLNMFNGIFNLKHFIPLDWMTEFFAPLASGGYQQDYFNLVFSLLFPTLFLMFERKLVSIGTSDKFRPIYYFTIISLILLFGVLGDATRFIYMQF